MKQAICYLENSKGEKYFYTLDRGIHDMTMVIQCTKNGEHAGETCHILYVDSTGIASVGGFKGEGIRCYKNKVVIHQPKLTTLREGREDDTILISLQQYNNRRFNIVVVDTDGKVLYTVAYITPNGVYRVTLPKNTAFAIDKGKRVKVFI